MTIERRNPENIDQPTASYSLVSIAPPDGQIGVISGQTGRRIDGSMSEGSYDQALDALTNINMALLDLRRDMSDVLILRWLVVDQSNADSVSAARDKFMATAASAGDPPSSTMAIVSGLADPRALLEVEAWFVT